MNVQIETGWKKILGGEFNKDYFISLTKIVQEKYLTHTVFPLAKNIFTAFNLCPFGKVKVVILGQDPYHGLGQAHGLAFSVLDGVPTPPSLKNIYKEIKADLNKNIPSSGNLEKWAVQGVLLLNSTLTVEKDKAGSHQGLGWETFTDVVISKISQEKTHVVFLLWGNFAISKRVLIDESKHLVLTAPHPSPLSAHRGFFGSKNFSQTNTYLTKHSQTEIIW